MKNKTTFELASRLNEITKELNTLEFKEATLLKEYNEIVMELWERIPNLKDSPDIQPKRKMRKKNGF